MRLVYSFLIACAAPVAFLIVVLRGFADRGYWQGLAERFGLGPARQGSIWVHAVSMGEMSAAAPLIRALQTRYPGHPLLLTTATPAGRARATALFGSECEVRFLPYDTWGAMRRFLARIDPKICIIMETELWPNLFAACARRGVPLILANARLSAKSVDAYRRFGGLFRGLFTDNVRVAAQSREDARRFLDIGAAVDSTHHIGNVKFDLLLEPAVIAQGRALRAAIGSTRAVWIAGSTHPGEDEAVIAAHGQLLKALPTALLILVPRHKDRFEPVASLLQAQGLTFARRSRGETPSPPQQVLLGDTLGELNLLYAAADVAFVGGSLVPIGGHNLLEPAAQRLPVLTGPSYGNSHEVAQLLLTRNAARLVGDSAELAQALQELLSQPDLRQRMGLVGEHIVAENRGSVERLLALIIPLLAVSPSAER
jgi:3-deoxy-D-manno-octulosonic-acid transferase